jgi:hypothetical protein
LVGKQFFVPPASLRRNLNLDFPQVQRQTFPRDAKYSHFKTIFGAKSALGELVFAPARTSAGNRKKLVTFCFVFPGGKPLR